MRIVWFARDRYCRARGVGIGNASELVNVVHDADVVDHGKLTEQRVGSAVIETQVVSELVHERSGFLEHQRDSRVSGLEIAERDDDVVAPDLRQAGRARLPRGAG